RVVEEQSARLRPSGKELIDLLNSNGRVLAEPVMADRDFPPFPRATRDGYALRSSDAAQPYVKLPIVGEIRAGARQQEATELQAGPALAIMTGAPVPPGADAVVMVEYTQQHGDSIVLNKAIEGGENIVSAGAEAKRGQLLLPSGARLDPASLALAAAVGR